MPQSQKSRQSVSLVPSVVDFAPWRKQPELTGEILMGLGFHGTLLDLEWCIMVEYAWLKPLCGTSSKLEAVTDAIRT